VTTARRRAALAVLLVVPAALILDLHRPSRAFAVEGASLSAEVMYRVDPERPAVDVEASYSMTNLRPDRDLGGGRVEYYFFTGMIAPVDANAVDVDVQINGRDGDFSIETDEGGLPFLEIRFGYELRYRRTADVVVTYTLLGDPPRSEESFVRVNPAYVSFPVLGWGDPGEVTVQIVVPQNWDVDYVGDDLEQVTFGDSLVFQSTEIADPDTWFVFFTARDDDRLDHTTLTAGNNDFDIASWPGDDLWLEFATEHIEDGVPVLEELIGHGWPVAGLTEITEASTSYLEGYGGFYDARLDSIEIGEDLDEHVILHELTHAWFNATTIDDRWLYEALAEEVSARAVERLGSDRPDPRTNAAIRADWGALETFPLVDWPPPFGDTEDSTEDYGYAESQRVMRAIWDELGDARMTELLAAVVAGAQAYPGEGDQPIYPGAIGWREFLDLAEQIGGSDEIQSLYVEHVLDAAGRRELDRRNEVVESYEELVARGDTWTPPAWVRTAMALWLLETAGDRIDAASDALVLAETLQSALAELGLSTTTEVERRYEHAADGLDDVTDELARLVESAGDLAEARGDLVGVLEEVGLDVPPLTQEQYELDPFGVVEHTGGLVSDADAIATAAAELRKLLDEAGLDVPGLDESAFVEDRTGALQLLTDRLAAAQAVVETRRARSAATSFVEGIGLYRSDIDGDIDQLEAELAQGDLTEVHRLSDAILEEIDDLDELGRQRITRSGLAAAAVLLLLLGTLVWIRRRRTERTAVHESSDHDAATHAPTTTAAGADHSTDDREGEGSDTEVVPPDSAH
jgi:hypothetical protein